jgi:hypothetical protein
MAIAAMILILGGAAGAVILGLCYVSSRSDEQQKMMIRRETRKEK